MESRSPQLTATQIEEQKWSPELYKTFSFGHVQPWIDWIWIEFLADPTLKHIEEGKRSNAFFRTDLITEIDPLFFEAYYIGGLLSDIVRKDHHGAHRLLSKGETFRLEKLPSFGKKFHDIYWPESWRIPFQLAYLYLYEIPDFEKAGVSFRSASKGKGAPAYFASVGKQLETPEGQYEVARIILDYLLKIRTDERELEKYRSQKSRLEFGLFLFECEKKALAKNPRSLAAGLAKVPNCQRDPLGGAISVAQDGKLKTTSHHERMGGLRY